MRSNSSPVVVMQSLPTSSAMQSYLTCGAVKDYEIILDKLNILCYNYYIKMILERRR